MSKTLLLLGGSAQQVCAIEYARNRGYRTVLCDYLPDNPGRLVADHYYPASTTDRAKILEIGQAEHIDGIVSYASDPAATTAAYVAETLGLPTNSLASVETLANKSHFRNYLRMHGFHQPQSWCLDLATPIDLDKNKMQELAGRLPLLAKPVDSSGSKGITLVEHAADLKEAIQFARTYSRSGQVILEQFIQRDHESVIGGDLFVLDGKIQFFGLLNSHRDPAWNPFLPIGTSFPLDLETKRLQLLKSETQRLMSLLGITFGAFNLEAIFDVRDQLYFIELGPRNGGNLIPGFLKSLTSVDTLAATIESALGEKAAHLLKTGPSPDPLFRANYVLRASQTGTLQAFHFDPTLHDRIYDVVFYKKPGQHVESFMHAGQAIGLVFMKFSSALEMKDILARLSELIRIEIK